MELRKKDTILEESIRKSEEFGNKYEFIKGYFSDLFSVDNNNDFLEVYRYVQYWNLEVPDFLKDYASTPNYCVKSLLSNMLLTGEDRYYKLLSDIILKSSFNYSMNNIFLPTIGNTPFLDLAKNNKAELAGSFLMDGHPPHDIFSSSSEGNATLQIVKTMMSEGYIPSDEIIIWYVSKGMGGVARECITECSDINFIFEEDPIDVDFFDFMYEDLSHNYGLLKIEPDNAERILYRQFDTKMEIDVALFMKLYMITKPILTIQSKLSILHHVVDKNEFMLTFQLLKELDDDGVSRERVQNLLLYTAKSISGYIIFSLQIVGEKNYDKIFDYCCDIDTEEKTVYYKPTTQEEEDLANGISSDTSSNASERDIENNYEFESRENSEIPNRYRYNSSDEPEETYESENEDV